MPREIQREREREMGSTHLKDLPQDRHDEVHRLDAEEDA